MEENGSEHGTTERKGNQRAPHLYHLILCAEHFVFSNEADKYEMLRRIERTGITEKCRVTGFILLDNELHMIIRAASGEAVGYAWRAYAEYIRYCCRKYGDALSTDVFTARIRCMPIHGSRYLYELLDLHLLCVREGYATDLNAYWWSSFQTYRGVYRWRFLETKETLQLFSDDRQKAINSFKRLQKARYNMQAAIGKSF